MRDRGSAVTTTLAVHRPARQVPLVVAVAGALLLAGLALAGPAAAFEDPAAPTARVTQGPSCGPGIIRVQVTNGDREHRVALVFDGTDEQDAAALTPDEQVELRSTDIDRGMTVDVSVTVTSADGATVDEPLELGTYTRPTRADCDAVSGPGAPATTTPSTEPPAGPSGGGAPATPSATAAPTTAGPTRSTPTPAPTRPTGKTHPTGKTRPIPSAGSSSGAPASTTGTPSAGSTTPGGRHAAPSVAPGGRVTLRGAGFSPGESVHVSVPGVDEPLTTVTAAADGTVEAVVQIPQGTHLGPLTVQLVGQDSASTAGLDLQVAGQHVPVSFATPTPVLAAGSALLVAGAALGLYAARRPRADADGVPDRRR